MKRTLGLIIGRFQPFHKGHLLLVKTALKENHATLILIGSINKDDASNPYDYELRKEIILGELEEEKISIGGVPDFPDDDAWVEYIVSFIPENVDEVTLYCGDIKNDSAVKALKSRQNSFFFDFKIQEIPRSIINISATQIRKELGERTEENLHTFLGEKTLKKLKRKT